MKKLLLMFCLLPYMALAQTLSPDVPLADATQEAQARELFRELRCEVCDGQTIADSNAALASDMRALVRSKIAAGEEKPQILIFFAERYGDAILMRPPVASRTAPLWFAPLGFLILGGFVFARYFRRDKQVA
ncbi:MAG: cytochrome c-type biogenesis protein CcmH [Alphaproteobacteria bacterium]|nr:cytochrome c-type biogenesis protein CcmH [Alphaproteobacteria bacterium]